MEGRDVVLRREEEDIGEGVFVDYWERFSEEVGRGEEEREKEKRREKG